MIRFKVVKGSHVLLLLSVLLLLGVLLFIYLDAGAANSSAPADSSAMQNCMASADTEAEARAGLASASAAAVFHVQMIPDAAPAVSNAVPCILIYHTHTHEAYAQDESDPYTAIETWRTTDETHSVVRVGEALAKELLAQGFRVVHDTTDHEQDDINTAYARSAATLQSYPEPFDLYIDLHRDAYVEGLSPCLKAGDESEYAQTMLLIGRGDDYSGTEKPCYEENLGFAQAVTSAMNRSLPGICRNVLVKKGRYNQNIGVWSILVEVGHNRNTLAQALNSVPYLAKGISSALQSMWHND